MPKNLNQSKIWKFKPLLGTKNSYNKPCFETAHLWENAKYNFQEKVAQKCCHFWDNLCIQKITESFQNLSNWQKLHNLATLLTRGVNVQHGTNAPAYSSGDERRLTTLTPLRRCVARGPAGLCTSSGSSSTSRIRRPERRWCGCSQSFEKKNVKKRFFSVVDAAAN